MGAVGFGVSNVERVPGCLYATRSSESMPVRHGHLEKQVHSDTAQAAQDPSRPEAEVAGQKFGGR